MMEALSIPETPKLPTEILTRRQTSKTKPVRANTDFLHTFSSILGLPVDSCGFVGSVVSFVSSSVDFVTPVGCFVSSVVDFVVSLVVFVTPPVPPVGGFVSSDGNLVASAGGLACRFFLAEARLAGASGGKAKQSAEEFSRITLASL